MTVSCPECGGKTIDIYIDEEDDNMWYCWNCGYSSIDFDDFDL